MLKKREYRAHDLKQKHLRVYLHELAFFIETDPKYQSQGSFFMSKTQFYFGAVFEECNYLIKSEPKSRLSAKHSSWGGCPAVGRWADRSVSVQPGRTTVTFCQSVPITESRLFPLKKRKKKETNLGWFFQAQWKQFSSWHQAPGRFHVWKHSWHSALLQPDILTGFCKKPFGNTAFWCKLQGLIHVIACKLIPILCLIQKHCNGQPWDRGTSLSVPPMCHSSSLRGSTDTKHKITIQKVL